VQANLEKRMNLKQKRVGKLDMARSKKPALKKETKKVERDLEAET
jgi:hypothetical protein